MAAGSRRFKMVDKVRSYDMTNNITLADVLKVCSVAKRGKCMHKRNGYLCPHFTSHVICYEIPAKDYELYFKPISGDESC